ncbi:VpsF family polysaccharide biosynthesis protein [Kaistia adipata]|uniref:VpsF family polysaccharide biosynthesis protein n=1 Tax=Kaistia adipata TaxID=166954 RepID=UPI000405362D|nr:VpsF family polysaccharide biosynthesis protein [Kaistia adipata]
MSLVATTPVRRPIRIPWPIGLASALTVLCLLVLFFVSSGVLEASGIRYGSPGGSPLSKFHPATYLALAALGLWAIAIGPGRLLAALAAQRPGTLIFALAILLLTFQTAVVQKLPISAIVDTFVLPLALFVSISSLRAPATERLLIGMHLFFLLNSTIGYLEYLTPFRLTPTYEHGEIVTYDWRATALLGHPLVNALATGTYLLILTGPGGRRFDMPLRAALLIYSLGAMVAFGGRAATVALLGLLAVRGGLEIARILAGRPFRLRGALLGILFLTGIAIAGSLLVQAGAFDSFLSRFENDYGSAATRVAMFSIFDGMNLRDVFFAPDLEHIASNQRRLDLAIGIESFVVAFFAYYGVVTTVLFFLGLAAFCTEIVRTVGLAALLPLAYYFVITSTSTGIANKTIDFALIMAMIMILLDRRFIPAETDKPAAC